MFNFRIPTEQILGKVLNGVLRKGLRSSGRSSFQTLEITYALFLWSVVSSSRCVSTPRRTLDRNVTHCPGQRSRRGQPEVNLLRNTLRPPNFDRRDQSSFSLYYCKIPRLRTPMVRTITTIGRFQTQRCQGPGQGIKSDPSGDVFQSSEPRAGQMTRHKIFKYLAISQVCCNKFCSNFQRITILYTYDTFESYITIPETIVSDYIRVGNYRFWPILWLIQISTHY